ncbi:MAG: hypothetical protein JWM96_1338, partial [Alphaproteobacteria bacterium]|nr:hypothetical protein [Alphaproteobacteria bacterium]
MSLKSVLLSTFFAGNMLAAFGQGGNSTPAKSPVFHLHSQQVEYAETQALIEKTRREAKNPGCKTGILIINGPEEKQASGNFLLKSVQDRDSNTVNLIKTFDNNIVEVVGSAVYGVREDSIHARLKKLGREVTDEIVIINWQHGSTDTTVENGIESIDNVVSISENTSETTLDYYGRMANVIKSDPQLRNKKYKVVHIPCFSYTAGNALTQFPPGTDAYITSDADKPQYVHNYITNLRTPFLNKNKEASGSEIITAAFLFANLDISKERYNNGKLIHVTGKASDTLSLAPGYRIYNHGRYATVIDPVEDLFRLKKSNIRKAELATS